MILDVYRPDSSWAFIEQLPLQRDWMDSTFDKHAYHCFPMSLANRTGWYISFIEDVSFIWDGTDTPEGQYIKILSGDRFASARRGNRTVSFDTGLYISPEKNVSILTIPPPNFFFEGFQSVSTVISTSALIGDFPIAIMVNKPNEVITIKAGTPVAALIPISLTELNNTELIVKPGHPKFMSSPDWSEKMRKRSLVSQEKNSNAEWTNFYRNAVDPDGNKYGEHEAKKVIMKVTYEN